MKETSDSTRARGAIPAKEPAADSSGDAPAVRNATTRCPFCHADVDVRSGSWVVCSLCLARHHEGCWTESRDLCASCGEASGLRSSAATAPVKAPRTIDGALIQAIRAAAHTGRVCSLIFLLGLCLYRGQNAIILSMGGILADLDLKTTAAHGVLPLPATTTAAWFGFSWSVAYLLAFLAVYVIALEPARELLAFLRRVGFARATVAGSAEDSFRAVRDFVCDLGERRADAGELDLAIECLELARDIEARPSALEPSILPGRRSKASHDVEAKIRNRLAVLEAHRLVAQRPAEPAPDEGIAPRE